MKKKPDYMTATCVVCGGKRHKLSGKRCRACYQRDAVLRKEDSALGKVHNALLGAWRNGEVIRVVGDMWAVPPT